MLFENRIPRPLLVLVAYAMAACGGPSDDSASAGDQKSEGEARTEAPTWTPTATEIERATELGRSAATRLAGTLVEQLSAQLQAGGVESAIEFCSAEAMALTDAVSEELGTLDVKRTATRLRNPDNAPDGLERAALAHFQREMAAGTLPDGWVQTVGDDELRYYQPLMVSEMCTQCHGPVADLQPGVRERLDELYPEDQAVGYAPGDLRGLIRVVVPREILERG